MTKCKLPNLGKIISKGISLGQEMELEQRMTVADIQIIYAFLAVSLNLHAKVTYFIFKELK